jgi:SpoVK/Ycf46/Vps4 family AAA+-type ATPase
VFFDEFQALFGERDGGGKISGQMASQLLLQMDELQAMEGADDDDGDGDGDGDDGDGSDGGESGGGLSRGRTPGSSGGPGAAAGGGVPSRAAARRVVIVAATNMPQAIDAAFLRPGR